MCTRLLGNLNATRSQLSTGSAITTSSSIRLSCDRVWFQQQSHSSPTCCSLLHRINTASREDVRKLQPIAGLHVFSSRSTRLPRIWPLNWKHRNFTSTSQSGTFITQFSNPPGPKLPILAIMSGSRHEPFTLSSDDDDDDEQLRQAIALSLLDQSSTQGKEQACEHGGEESENPASDVSSQGEKQNATFGSLTLDRRAMEAERLKRATAKRQRESVGDDSAKQVLPNKKAKPSAAGTPASPIAAIPYPNGVVKRTRVYGHPKCDDDITIEEVLQRDHLELAILSSFQWDEEWLLSKVDMPRTKLLLVASAADEAQKETMRANVPPNIRFSFPRMQGFGNMHSKLQVLRFPTYLRVVVPTGNLVPYDWGETGVMENMLFMIDLPLLESAKHQEPTMFMRELCRFLRASDVNENMVASLSKYDFSRTTNLGFVHTIPGSHMDDERQTGYAGLGASVAALGHGTKSAIEVDLVASSLGSLKSDLIECIYNACQGDDGMKEYTSRSSRKTSAQKTSGISQKFKDRFRIYFPSEETVVKSRGGRGAGGTICLQEKWWRAPTFPRELIHDCVNDRGGILMHSKLIFVRNAENGEGNNSAAPRSQGWAYIGSANLSESAWGRMVKDSSTGKPKMSCRNWECGVVIPLAPGGSDNDQGKAAVSTATGPTLASRFENGPVPVPVPMRVPAEPLGTDQQPWFY